MLKNREDSSISHVFINVETTSKIDLRAVSLQQFASDQSTIILIISCIFRDNSGSLNEYNLINSSILSDRNSTDGSKKCWELLRQALEDTATFVAHSAAFARTLFKYKLAKQFDEATWLDTSCLAQQVNLSCQLFKLADNFVIEHSIKISRYKQLINDYCIQTSTKIFSNSLLEFNEFVGFAVKKVMLVKKIWASIPILPKFTIQNFELIYNMNNNIFSIDKTLLNNLIKKITDKSSLYLQFLKELQHKISTNNKQLLNFFYLSRYWKFKTLPLVSDNKLKKLLIPENLPYLITTKKIFYILQFDFNRESLYKEISNDTLLVKKIHTEAAKQRGLQLSSIKLKFDISIMKMQKWLAINLPCIADFLYYKPHTGEKITEIHHLNTRQNNMPVSQENKTILYRQNTLDELAQDLPIAITHNIQLAYIDKLNAHLKLVFMNDDILMFECEKHEAHDIKKYVENMPMWLEKIPFKLYYIRNDVAIDNVRCSKKTYNENLLHS